MAITISTLNYPEELKTRLARKECSLSSEGKKFSYREKWNDEYKLYKICLEEESLDRDLIESLADVVAELVIDNLEEKLLERIINNYEGFNSREKEIIKSLSLKHLNTEEDNSLARIIRKREIVSQILGYFNKNRELNIEGFVRFRLKSYIQDLRYAVQKAIDDFNVEKEYNEFIDLLRYFVELQEPQRGPVNVLKKGDSFELLDEKGREIDDPHMEKCLQELTAEQNQVEFEDLLISALVNISPAEVILHFRDSEVIEVLGCIFREKIVLCEGCDLCDSE